MCAHRPISASCVPRWDVNPEEGTASLWRSAPAIHVDSSHWLQPGLKVNHASTGKLRPSACGPPFNESYRGDVLMWALSALLRCFFFLPCRARHDSSDGRSRLHTIRTQFKRNKRSRPWGKQTKQATKQQNTTPKPNKKPQTRQPAKPSPKIEITQVKR